MRLQELFERVIPYKTQGDKGVFKYGPNASRTMKMELAHGRQGEGSYEISFYPEDRKGADQFAADDSGGEELSIFQTVMAFVDEWYNANKDKVNMLFAEPSINDKYTGKRHRLYTKMAEKMKKKYGGTVKTNGQFVMWYPEKEESTKHTKSIQIIQKIFANESFWGEVSEEGSVHKSIRSLELTFYDANLGDHLFELEQKSVDDDLEINVDSDVYYELMDNSNFDKQFNQDAKEFINMLGN